MPGGGLWAAVPQQGIEVGGAGRWERPLGRGAAIGWLRRAEVRPAAYRHDRYRDGSFNQAPHNTSVHYSPIPWTETTTCALASTFGAFNLRRFTPRFTLSLRIVIHDHVWCSGTTNSTISCCETTSLTRDLGSGSRVPYTAVLGHYESQAQGRGNGTQFAQEEE